MNSTNNFSARNAYDIAKRVLLNAWLPSFGPTESDRQRAMDWVNNRKLSQGEIRLEVNLTTTSNVFNFGVTPNQANTSNVVFATEQRLNLQDSLIASEYGIFVGQASGNTDTAYRLHTYGNQLDFAAADANALDTTFYSNGSFQLNCNNDTLVPYRGLFNHYYVPQTQQTAAFGAASPHDQIRGAEDGFVTLEPNILLIGSKNYVPQIVLRSNLASAAANLRCVLIIRGILAQNSTVIN